MPRPVKPIRRSIAFAFCIALLPSACTGDDGGSNRNGATGEPTGGTGVTNDGPTPVESGSATAGTYEYVNAGLHVTITIDGNEGRMEVENGTDRELPRPDFYILNARDGTEISGDVADPAPIPAGETVTFDVAFEGVEVRDIGLLILLFGSDNYGASVRTA
jgi:hypothetical protein